MRTRWCNRQGQCDGKKWRQVDRSSTQVKNDVQTDRGAQLFISNSYIGNNVRIKKVQAGNGLSGVENSTIGNDLQVNENASEVGLLCSIVGNNLQANKNSAGLTIEANVIDGNLECKDNAPAPTGGGNVVGGDAKDQCKALAR